METNWNKQANRIQEILYEDFPGAEIRNITSDMRYNGEQSMRCTINGLGFHLGFLPDNSRKKIWKLLNQ